MGHRGSLHRRAVIVLTYLAVFWVALPYVLWRVAVFFDSRLRIRLEPWSGGWVVAAVGAALMLAGMLALLVRGRGLPVSALPPPRLVIVGPYRWVRHPVYLGCHLAVVGVGLAVGSVGLALVVGVAFLPCWIAYALVEERGLRRRFGADYRSYQRQVGLLPRVDTYRLSQVLARALLPVRVEGRAAIPRRGGAIIVANHACYADPVFLQCTTWRRIHFLATAESFRGGVMAWAIRRSSAIPLRRYRVDPGAHREMLRRVGQGALVGVFVEGERSPLGAYQGALPHVARMLGHHGIPVFPVGISGNYDAGPRWAGQLRVRPVRLRVGAPIAFDGQDPARTVDRAIRALIDENPQPMHLEGLDRAKLHRVLWRCPACLDERGWRPQELRCGACGARWQPTTEGRFQDDDGVDLTLAELAHPVWQEAESQPLTTPAHGAVERSITGEIEPLVPLGTGELVVGPNGLTFGDLVIGIAELRTTSTERADTLQVATSTRMWQFRPANGSVFRLQRALDRWRDAGHEAMEREA